MLPRTIAFFFFLSKKPFFKGNVESSGKGAEGCLEGIWKEERKGDIGANWRNEEKKPLGAEGLCFHLFISLNSRQILVA